MRIGLKWLAIALGVCAYDRASHLDPFVDHLGGIPPSHLDAAAAEFPRMSAVEQEHILQDLRQLSKAQTERLESHFDSPMAHAQRRANIDRLEGFIHRLQNGHRFSHSSGNQKHREPWWAGVGVAVRINILGLSLLCLCMCSCLFLCLQNRQQLAAAPPTIRT